MLQEPIESPATPTPIEALDALVELANSMESFRVTYSIRQPGWETCTITLCYEAPHRMRLDLLCPGSDSSYWSMWSVDERLGMLSREQPDQLMWASMDYGEGASPMAIATLDRLFPSGTTAIDPGPAVQVEWKLDPESERIDFNFALAWVRRGRVTPLGWLERLRSEPDLLEVRADTIVQVHPRYRAEVSRATGFLSELEVVGGDGEKLQLSLVELDPDPEWDEELFVLPERPENAKDVSARLEEWEAHRCNPHVVRRNCYQRVDGQLERGLMEWDESTRNSWRNVMRDLHEEWMKAPAAEYVEENRLYVETLCEWIMTERARGETVETLRTQVAEIRKGNAEELERIMADGFDMFAAADREYRLSDQAGKLRAAEREVYDKLYHELYVRPALEEFDAAVADVLDG